MMQNYKTKKERKIWSVLYITAGLALIYAFLPTVKFFPGSVAEMAAAAQSVDSPVPGSSRKMPAPKYYSYVSSSHPTSPNISAGAYVVGDLDTGEIILSKNKNAKHPQASVSKLMTAYIASALNKDDSTAVISKTALATQGQRGEFRSGEKIKISTLLYPLLMESSNDAAEALAEHFDRSTFLRKMNQFAGELGLTETSYQDPSGLSSGNVTSAEDMFRLAGFIYQNADDIFKITLNTSYRADGHNWQNISEFKNDKGYLGGKTGYTDPAKDTATVLYSLKLANGSTRNICISILQSDGRKKDVDSIISFLQKYIRYSGPANSETKWASLPEGAPDISWPDSLSVVLGGDIMMDRGVRSSVNSNFGSNYYRLFDNLGILKDADISFANLEGTISYKGEDQGYLNPFRMSPTVLPALEKSGLKVLSVANGHIGDWGISAFMDTLQNLKNNGIDYVGGGRSKEEAKQPVIFEKYGMTIGFLAFSDKGSGLPAATPGRPGILLAVDPKLPEIIKNAAKQVDFLIVYFNFGSEYRKEHEARQEELAHEAIDSGARLVTGSGTHVVEDTEKYKNGYIAYSLGNMIFDQSFSKDTMTGALLETTVNRDGSFSVQEDSLPINSRFQPEKPIPGKETVIKKN